MLKASLLFLPLLGTALLAGAFGTISTDLLNGAHTVAAQANMHQLQTALELYHYKHQAYPNVSGGEALFEELAREGYINRAPARASHFLYEVYDNAQEYTLSLHVADGGEAATDELAASLEAFEE